MCLQYVEQLQIGYIHDLITYPESKATVLREQIINWKKKKKNLSHWINPILKIVKKEKKKKEKKKIYILLTITEIFLY